MGGLVARGAMVLLLAGVLAACGTAAVHRDTLLSIPVPDRVTVTTSNIPGVGPVLTDSAGQALYMFPNDAGRSVTCIGGCAGTWPPLVIADGHNPTAGGLAKASMLGTLPDPNTGARVVTYKGNPLYRYAGDTSPHTAFGQDIESDGGPWWVLTPAGKPITTPITAQAARRPGASAPPTPPPSSSTPATTQVVQTTAPPTTAPPGSNTASAQPTALPQGTSPAGPQLSAVSPAAGAPGQVVEVSGDNLNSSDGTVVASFNGQQTQTVCSTTTACDVTVPDLGSSLVTATVTVTTAQGTSNGLAFSYTPSNPGVGQ